MKMIMSGHRTTESNQRCELNIPIKGVIDVRVK